MVLTQSGFVRGRHSSVRRGFTREFDATFLSMTFLCMKLGDTSRRTTLYFMDFYDNLILMVILMTLELRGFFKGFSHGLSRALLMWGVLL